MSPELAQSGPVQSFSIPPQALTSALDLFSDQTGVAFAYATSQLQGVASPGVNGELTSRQALEALLAGTGVTYQFTGPDTVTLDRATAGQESGDESILLGPILVEGEALEESAYGPVDGYLAGRSATATKTDTAIRDTPNSIQVIPRDVIDDQQAISIQEVLNNAAGVTYQGNDFGRESEFSIRGFTGALILQDGISPFGFRSRQAEVEVANIERAEVVRGPAVLYGQVEPGGAVNIVTKKPLEEPTYNFQLQGGNRKFVSPMADVSGPVTEDNSLLYRLVALYRQEDSWQNYDQNFQRAFVAPSGTWRPNEDTDLTVRFEYIQDKDPLVMGLPAIGDGVADIPYDRVMNNPDDTLDQESLIAGYQFEHRFSDAWKLRNQFSYFYGSHDWGVVAAPIFLDESNGDLTRLFLSSDNFAHTYATDINLQGKFATGSVDHTGLIGVDFTNFDQENRVRVAFEPEFLSTINIFDPDYNAVPKPRKDDIPLSNDDRIDQSQVGVYAQDQIDLLEDFSIVGGLRFDYFKARSKSNLSGEVTQDFSETAWSPRVGAIYRPIEPLTFFANYSQSFTPNFVNDFTGDVLPPEEGEGFEVGVKVDFIPNLLSSTLAFYDIRKKNVATTDLNNPFASIAAGEVRSRGFDVDLTGEILPGWNIVAGYAYVDAEVTKDNDPNLVGNELIGIPQHSGSIWTTYEFQTGKFKGLGAGIGLNYEGRRAGDISNTFQVDGYTVANAGVFYRWQNWEARLNVDNIFDTDYIEYVSSFTGGRANGSVPGAPFTVRASVSVTF